MAACPHMQRRAHGQICSRCPKGPSTGSPGTQQRRRGLRLGSGVGTVLAVAWDLGAEALWGGVGLGKPGRNEGRTWRSR